jgi:gliding motility-associated-like protein
VTVDQFGCTASYTDTVTIYPNPVPLFDGDTAGCVPLDVQFTDLSTAWTPMTWKWTFGDAGGSSLQHPQHLYMNDGLFDVGLTIQTSTGCIDTVTLVMQDYIEGWQQPVAGFLVNPPTVNILEPEVLITDNSTHSVEWLYWVNGEAFTEPSFVYSFPDAGEYVITQIVSTSSFCMDTTSRVVIVRDHLFYAPNAFSPDGDGVNEVFLPSVKGAREYELLVFDRWGEVVFRTNTQDEGWTGAGFPPEVYAFQARIVTFGSARKDYFGHVTLVR